MIVAIIAIATLYILANRVLRLQVVDDTARRGMPEAILRIMNMNSDTEFKERINAIVAL